MFMECKTTIFCISYGNKLISLLDKNRTPCDFILAATIIVFFGWGETWWTPTIIFLCCAISLEFKKKILIFWLLAILWRWGGQGAAV